eukprot:CAMPEP_0195290826 /NCGR_PEP_ID=MMETSP0707-20130614/6539_1 /TAXON_ID=33640 /ORGANISM="Asterionellopsis glacialis, Strain CCMP134" /LENGTH=258 /DNA_ID=CAMNT_0040351007 /DNA_START=88 /DNA_END=864 /DNA_ORIENTATION=-
MRFLLVTATLTSFSLALNVNVLTSQQPRTRAHSFSQNANEIIEIHHDGTTGAADQILTSRRDAFKVASITACFPFLAGLGSISDPASAEEGEGDTKDSATPASNDSIIFVKGTVSLPDDFIPLDESATPALYVTCRPDRPDNVPTAILSGTRGKPPPVLVARFQNPTFPFDFELSGKDLTVEGISDGKTQIENSDNYWWKNDDLIVSARLDSDGVAATRSPDDLVGRGLNKKSDTSPVNVPLRGRGIAGKFATGGTKK